MKKYIYILYYLCKQNGDPNIIYARCLIYWRGSRAGLFFIFFIFFFLVGREKGERKKKIIIIKRIKLCVRRTERAKPAMYKSKSFSIRKMATAAGRNAPRAIFACGTSPGMSGRPPGLFCTDRGDAWFSDSYLTRKTLRDTRRTSCFRIRIIIFRTHIVPSIISQPLFLFPGNNIRFWRPSSVPELSSPSFTPKRIRIKNPLWFIPVGRFTINTYTWRIRVPTVPGS